MPQKARRLNRSPLCAVGIGVAAGDAIDEQGMLVREGGGFVLQRDLGGRWRLDFARVPVDLVGKRVRIVGIEAGDGLVDVAGVRAA